MKDQGSFDFGNVDELIRDLDDALKKGDLLVEDDTNYAEEDGWEALELESNKSRYATNFLVKHFTGKSPHNLGDMRVEVERMKESFFSYKRQMELSGEDKFIKISEELDLQYVAQIASLNFDKYTSIAGKVEIDSPKYKAAINNCNFWSPIEEITKEAAENAD